MEASEKPRASQDAGVVRPLGDRLVIESLVVEDERAARVVRERAEAGRAPADTVRKSIEIGARVLDSEGTAANVDYVRAELERGVGALNVELSSTLEEGNEALAERIAAAFGADRSGSVQQQIKEIVRNANEEQRGAISRLFSAEDGANPLTDFKNAVVRSVGDLKVAHQTEREADRKRIEALHAELVALRERFGAKEELAAEQERGTAKGRSFEQRVHEALERLAESRGDAAFHVGDEPGKGGSKKGDTVVEIEAAMGPAAARIVFEAKDRQLSKNKAWEELNDAMAEREAEFAVLVVAGDESVPAGREELHEYEGNKLIIAVDPDQPDELGLKLAYSYARCRVVLAGEAELDLEAPAVRAAAAEALSALKAAQSIKLHLTKAQSGVTEARVGLEQMAEVLRERLEQIEALASGG